MLDVGLSGLLTGLQVVVMHLGAGLPQRYAAGHAFLDHRLLGGNLFGYFQNCLLYTSDAADE